MNNCHSLINEIKSCTICKAELGHAPRPVVQIHPSAKILIAGQAPGKKVHESGVPFNDASGKRLREWLGLSSEQFYDSSKVAILPMGFCYPGTGKSGDLAPRVECAPAWREKVLNELNQIELIIVLGRYAQKYHLNEPGQSLTDIVKAWRVYWPDKMVLPHPSPRNNIWLRNNPWFEDELLPLLKQRVSKIL